jgi:hypothetical protein
MGAKGGAHRVVGSDCSYFEPKCHLYDAPAPHSAFRQPRNEEGRWPYRSAPGSDNRVSDAGSRFSRIRADMPIHLRAFAGETTLGRTFALELSGVFARICTQQRIHEPFSVLDDKNVSGAVRGGDRVREGPLAHCAARAGCGYRSGDCEPAGGSRRRPKRFVRKFGRCDARPRVEPAPEYPLDLTTWRSRGIN